MENVDGDEADEGDPVQLLQQLGVGTTVEDEAPVGVPDEDHPPDEAEEESVVVSCHNNIPWEREQLTPAEVENIVEITGFPFREVQICV